jgi:peptidyl-tRNA hydrolase
VEILSQKLVFLLFILIVAVKRYQVNAQDLVVVHDDLERDIGKVSIKRRGSPKYYHNVNLFYRGHNGVRSIIASLGTEVLSKDF